MPSGQYGAVPRDPPFDQKSGVFLRVAVQTMSRCCRLQVETYPPDGPYIQATQSVATSGWFIAMMLAVALLLLILVLVCIIRRNRGGKYDVQDREHAHGRGDLYPEDGFQVRVCGGFGWCYLPFWLPENVTDRSAGIFQSSLSSICL